MLVGEPEDVAKRAAGAHERDDAGPVRLKGEHHEVDELTGTHLDLLPRAAAAVWGRGGGQASVGRRHLLAGDLLLELPEPRQIFVQLGAVATAELELEPINVRHDV